MAEITFTFADFHSKVDLNILVLNVKRNILPTISEQNQDIPGMNGLIYDGVSLGDKKIEVECMLPDKSEAERVQHIQDLSAFFTQTMTKDEEFELVLSDLPHVAYWCHTSDISSLERVAETTSETTFTITFSCSEGVGYGETVSMDITNETTIVNPIGTADTFPVLTLQPDKDVTQIGISDGEDYIYIGGSFDEENQDAPANLRPKILNDPCTTLAPWTKVTSSTLTFLIENGVLATDADMRSTGKALRATQKNDRDYFGANVSKKWHGPIRQQMLPRSLKDWKVTSRFYINNRYPRAKGKIELYLLDINGKRIGKLMVKDNGISLENLVQAQIGYQSEAGKYKDVFLSSRKYAALTKKGSSKKVKVTYKTKVKVVEKKSSKSKGKTVVKTVDKTKELNQSTAENKFTDFYGTITLEKIGKKYSAEVQLLNTNGTPKGKVMKDTFTDKNGAYGDYLAGIAVYVAKYDITEDTLDTKKDYYPNTLELSDVKIWEILGKENEIVAQKGDVITIDCDNGVVLKNGIRFLERTGIGSEFLKFNVNKDNVISVSPEPTTTMKWSLDYVPRYH